MDLHNLVNGYYKSRKLVEPMAHEALMLLISVVGKLVEAYLARQKRDVSAGMMNILVGMQYLGQRADKWVAGQNSGTSTLMPAGYYRKNGRPQDPNVEGEVAECLMMLERFSAQLGINPMDALVCKMREKGYDPDVYAIVERV